MPLYSTMDLGKRGLPFYDGNRIWSLRWKDSEYTGAGIFSACFDAIEYSDDYGKTWVTWKDDIQPRAAWWTLFKDSQGNFYYTTVGKLYRVDGVTKAITEAIIFTHETTYARPWSITEDNDGYIYVGQYVGYDAEGYVHIWKSPPGGTNFTRVDWIANIPGTRHIHSIQCAPYTNKIYITTGDANEDVWVSDDKLETMPTKIADDQFTGITFTSDAVYFSHDNPGQVGKNQVVKCVNDSVFTNIYEPPQPAGYNVSPIYYVRAVGDHELWLTVVDENFRTDQKTMVIRLTRTDYGEPWEDDIVLEGEGGVGGAIQGNVYLALSGNRNSVIPANAPYVFANWMPNGTEDRAANWPGGLIRIQRVEDSELPAEIGDFYTSGEPVLLGGSLLGSVTLPVTEKITLPGKKKKKRFNHGFNRGFNEGVA